MTAVRPRRRFVTFLSVVGGITIAVFFVLL